MCFPYEGVSVLWETISDLLAEPLSWRGPEAAPISKKRSPRARWPRVSDPWILSPGWGVFSPRGPSVSWADPEPRGPGTSAGLGGQPGRLVISCPPEHSRGRSLRDLLAGFCPGSPLPLTLPPATTLLGHRPASHLLESFLFQSRGYLVAQPPGRKEGMIPKSTLSAPAARLV